MTLESLEVSLGLAVAGVFEGVSWNLRALAERKEPIVVPQLVLVLGGLKLVSEGDTNKSELVLAKENGRGGFLPGPAGVAVLQSSSSQSVFDTSTGGVLVRGILF